MRRVTPTESISVGVSMLIMDVVLFTMFANCHMGGPETKMFTLDIAGAVDQERRNGRAHKD